MALGGEHRGNPVEPLVRIPPQPSCGHVLTTCGRRGSEQKVWLVPTLWTRRGMPGPCGKSALVWPGSKFWSSCQVERRRSAKPLLRGFDSHLDLHARKAQMAGQVLGKDEMVSSILTSGST